MVNTGRPGAVGDGNNMCAMARSHVARHLPGQVPARMLTVRLARRVRSGRPERLRGPGAHGRLRRLPGPVRGVAAAGVVALSAVLPLLAGSADAQASPAQPAAPGQPASGPLTLTVTSVSPAYAEQGRQVTITGRVKNTSASAASALSVQLLSSTTRLGSRQEMEKFAAGGYPLGGTPVGVAPVTRLTLGAGKSWDWSITFPASALGLTCFGVYPLTAEVGDAALSVASDPIPLPYWPTNARSCAGVPRPRPSPISWIWPLIDTPHQDACRGLIDNRLAGSIAPAGRLGSLLAVGSRYSARAGLTWAIDPALLDSVRVMRQPYQVGFSPKCGTEPQHPPSRAASRWLADLVKGTSGQPVFVTPYADADIAALTRAGNNADLQSSFTGADEVGQDVLGRAAVPADLPAGRRQLSAVAWPAGGIASGALLDSLATANVSTVILTAPAVSPVTYTPGAVTSTLTGTGIKLHVLLADHAITALLRSKAAASRTAGAIFGVSQLYLAETAMIAAEAPGMPRPIVVTPPRRWDPPRRLASGLLADTVQAPWLRPSTTGQLATMPPEHVYKQLTQSATGIEVSARLLSKVAKLDRRIALLQSIRTQPDPALGRAVFGIESAAWRGKAGKHARALLARTSAYVESQLRGVFIRGGAPRAVYHVTFGGKTSTIPVVIRNNLRYAVEVGLLVKASNAKVSGAPRWITIPPLSFSSSVKLTVHVESNQGRIRLSLITAKGPRAGHLLPAYPLVILVHPTDFGTVALVICAAVLALFVIGSAVRAIRHGHAEPGSAAEPPDPTGPPEPLDRPAPSGPLTAAGPLAPAGPLAAAGRPGELAPGRLAPDEPTAFYEPAASGPDDTARPDGTGWTSSPSGRIAPPDPQETPAGDHRNPERGFVDLGRRPEHTDSVGHDPSELTSAGPPVNDQEPAAPSRRATEERR